MKAERPAHKHGLEALALDLASVRSRYGFRRGAFDQAIANDENCPDWIRRNIGALRVIEQKAHNDGNLLENLKLALSAIEPINPVSTEQSAVSVP